jgi:hypothetical protein
VEISVIDLIEKLIELGIIPKKNEQGQTVAWKALDERGRQLDPERKLKDNGVATGHHIRVIPEPAPIPRPNGKDHKWPKPAITVVVLAALAGVGYLVYKKTGPTPNPTSISMQPANANILVPPGQYKFTATVSGASDTTVRWTTDCPARISTTGLLIVEGTIASRTSCTVTATSAADPTKSDQSAVTLIPRQSPQPVTSVSVNPPAASVPTPGRTEFSATVYGGHNPSVTWTTDCPGSSISPVNASNGLFTVPAAIPLSVIRPCMVIATAAADPTKSGRASVRLVPQTPPSPPRCRPGFVWREALPGDYVCVTPVTRALAQRDNVAAASRRNPSGGPYGPDTCLSGFVWREATPNDHVCVTPATRAQTLADNSQAASRRLP